MATYLSDNSYLMVKPEATAGTAVIPTILIPLVSSSLKTVTNYSADRRMKGLDWKSNDLLRGNRSHEGEITVLCDPDTLGHIMNMVMAKGSTTGSAPAGFTHPFTVGAPKSYTFEIKKGLYAQRYFGVYIDKVDFDFQDGQLQAKLSVKAMGQLSVATVGVALTGAAMTSLTLDDEYDIAPNRGFVVGDVINVGGVDLTLTSVASNGYAVGFASTTVTASIGAPVYLKPLTVTQPTLFDPLYFGNLFAGFGADATASATAAALRTTATPIYDFKFSINNNLFAQNGSSRMDPVQIVTQTKEAQVELMQLFTGVAQRQAWMDRSKQSLTLVFYGKFIQADFGTQEKFTLTLNRVKLLENEHEIKVGDLIVDNEKFEVLYDNTDGVAMSATLINRSAGTVY